jgi:hypothetical protein
MEKTHSRNYDLARLLSGIDSGTVGLPDFQRDYDWDTGDAISLLATVLSGWPIGSLLLMRDSDRDLFATRPFEGAPDVLPATEFVVLDGQQRLTALYHALYGRGSFRYALRLDVLGENWSIDSLEDSLEAISAEQWSASYASPADELNANLLPATALRGAAEFFEWRDLAEADLESEASRRLTRLYRSFLSGLHRYEIPAVVIDPDIPAAAIARIFERVNRLGMSLGTFDLMVATSFTTEFNLRRRWEEARSEHPRLDAFFGDDGTGLLTVISLRVRGDVRQSSVLEMGGGEVRLDWGPAVAAMDWAVGFAAHEFGVWWPDLLPYRSILTVLAGLKLGSDKLDREMITDWFWATCFGQRYNVGSNTRSVSDFKSLSRGISPIASEVSIAREDLLESNKKQFAALHRSVQCLILSGGPRDVISGEELNCDSLDSGALPPVRFASAFPRGFTSVSGEAGLHLRTLGLVAAGSRSARRVTASHFEDWDLEAAGTQMFDFSGRAATEPGAVLARRASAVISQLNSRSVTRFHSVERTSGPEGGSPVEG